MYFLVKALLPTALLFALGTNSATIAKRSTAKQVHLRIEGETSTIFEGVVFHPHGRNVTTPSGGTHSCDGTNHGANPTPGPTVTSALSQAANRPRGGFPFDGTYDSDYDDFSITSIDNVAQTFYQYWGFLVDYQFTPAGGCETEVAPNQDILWAFDAYNKMYFLKLVGPQKGQAGVPFTLSVTDGSSGVVISGASVGGQTTDSNGQVTITPEFEGPMSFKAEQSDAIRSNRIVVHVGAP